MHIIYPTTNGRSYWAHGYPMQHCIQI